ncbi:hypothetical protein QTH91_01215 [Variovorax dokdonensis]|uniref:Uncharacterized protein n=1 Tax=Variovorax dokdonensis TaxID=344883 RepID=A0ABT7N588_9BURK|nr:hypothetical protein [Variovorax dokdonensis]MDM0043090.1 hypothetical protein [Variovorax dokdonensis]
MPSPSSMLLASMVKREWSQEFKGMPAAASMAPAWKSWRFTMPSI